MENRYEINFSRKTCELPLPTKQTGGEFLKGSDQFPRYFETPNGKRIQVIRRNNRASARELTLPCHSPSWKGSPEAWAQGPPPPPPPCFHHCLLKGGGSKNSMTKTKTNSVQKTINYHYNHIRLSHFYAACMVFRKH